MVVATHVIRTADLAGVNVLTERVKKRKEEWLAAKDHACAERSRLITESWKETEGEPIDLRRAKAFQRILDGISIVIRAGELIVGSQTKYIRGASPYVEYNSVVTLKAFEGGKLVLGGEVREAEVTEEETKSLLEDAQYWRGRSAVDQIQKACRERYGSKLEDLVAARVILTSDVLPSAGRFVDWEKVLTKGLNGIIAEAEEELRKLTGVKEEEVEKGNFLRAVIIVLEAMIKYARRHAALARELASKERDEARKTELEKIADICEWVPANPPRNFHEALQSFWFIYLGLVLETSCPAALNGARFDQYMYPFYEKDIREGRMTRGEAAELLGLVFLKIKELTPFLEKSQKEISQNATQQNIVIAGVTRDGRDATNELSYLLLEVARQMRLPEPGIYVRYHDGLSEEFLIKAIEVNRDIGGGIPAFVNDKMTILNLVQHGISLEDAREYALEGCVHACIPHSSGYLGHVAQPNCAKMLELALHNGVDPETGKQLGPATGDARNFGSFEELYEAFKKQFTYFVELTAEAGRLAMYIRAEHYRYTFNSALLNDCIPKGKDWVKGGTRYTVISTGYNVRGQQNVSDSLVAIKKLVFNEKKISMSELLEALSVNFEGKEELRQMVLAAPKYGNDDDTADEMMRDLWSWTASVIHRQVNPWGGQMRDTRGGAAFHYWAGKTVCALPDGRKAYEPLADASLSPMRGVDMKGPTAVFNSASKVDQLSAWSSLLNQKLLPSSLQSKGGIRKLLALIKGYFDRYGYQVQFNMMSNETLRRAKEHPEEYSDLVVRVAGYSAFFVELGPEVQDEIIARNEHAI